MMRHIQLDGNTPSTTLPSEPRHDVAAAGASGRHSATVTVSVVIPALNEEQHLGRCLRAIELLERPPGLHVAEVIVVDNCSTDGTAEVGRQSGARVQTVSPGCPARARNAGARCASGDWLAFVDADCVLTQDWLAVCATHLLSDSEVAAVGGAMRCPDRSASWVERSSYELAHRSRSTAAQQVRWLPTFNLLVRRSAFEAVEGFDESLATCEDCDLGYRLAEIGRLVLEPRAQAEHLGQSRSLGELFRREAWRTRGNVRLAMARPTDWSNWLSLVFPPLVVLGFLAAIGGLAAALWAASPVWPWLATIAAISLAVVLLVVRRTSTANPMSLARQFVVFVTYLAGRAAGLAWSFRRVERQENA